MAVGVNAIFEKVRRADQHLEDLNRAAERFFDETRGLLYRLHGEVDAKRRKQRFLFRAELLQPLPVIEWGIRVGDAIHCLRSALDQLVYSLSDDPDKNTAFPIFKTEKDWFTQSPSFLWGVPDPLIAAIKAHQPYHRGDAAHAHPLAVLSTLSNTDKHRYIPVVALVPSVLAWGITQHKGVAEFGDLELIRGAVLETGAAIAEMPFTPDDSGDDPEVQMDGEIGFRIAFGKTGVPSSLVGKPLTPACVELGDAVMKVIEDVHEVMRQYLVSHGVSPSKG